MQVAEWWWRGAGMVQVHCYRYWRHRQEQVPMIHPANRDSQAWGRMLNRPVVIGTVSHHGEALVLVFDIVFGR